MSNQVRKEPPVRGVMETDPQCYRLGGAVGYHPTIRDYIKSLVDQIDSPSPKPAHGRQPRRDPLRPTKDFLQVCRAFLDLFLLSGLSVHSPEKIVDAMRKKRRMLEEHSRQGTLTMYLKYKTAAVFAWAHCQELPRKPDCVPADDRVWGPVFGGPFSRFTQRASIRLTGTRRARDDAAAFLQGLLMLKKGLPRPSKLQLREATRAFGPTMSQPDAGHHWMRWTHCDDLRCLCESCVFVRDPSNKVALGELERLRGEVVRTTSEVLAHQKQLLVRAGLKQATAYARAMRSEHAEHKSARPPLVLPAASAKLADFGLLHWPSSRAHYDFSRKVGGAFGAFHTAGEPWNPLDEDTPEASDLVLATAAQSRVLMRDPRVVRVGEMEDDHIVEELPTLLFDVNGQRALRRIAQSSLRHSAPDRPCRAEPMALPEPLKIRTISLGDPYRYAIAHSFQGFLHGLLTPFPQFVVNRDLTVSASMAVLRGLDATRGEMWVSGDYKAATDNLDSSLSVACLDTVLDWVVENERLIRPDLAEGEHILTVADRQVLVDALVGHEVPIYPSEEDGKRGLEAKGVRAREPDWVPQRRGQLMGSPISFPVLCLVNAALCRQVLEQDRFDHPGNDLDVRRPHDPFIGLRDPHDEDEMLFVPKLLIPLAEARMLINGDDCAFPATAWGHGVWQADAKTCGLQISVGKAYYSDRFMVMNSKMLEYDHGPERLFLPKLAATTGPLWRRLVEVDEETDAGSWFYAGGAFREMKYLNLNLLHAHVVDPDHPTTPSFNLAPNCSAMLDGVDPSLRQQAFDVFVGYSREVLGRYPSVPWFVPEKLGGFGLPPVYARRRAVTALDQMVLMAVHHGDREHAPGSVSGNREVSFYAHCVAELSQRFGSTEDPKAKDDGISPLQWHLLLRRDATGVPTTRPCGAVVSEWGERKIPPLVALNRWWRDAPRGALMAPPPGFVPSEQLQPRAEAGPAVMVRLG